MSNLCSNYHIILPVVLVGVVALIGRLVFEVVPPVSLVAVIIHLVLVGTVIIVLVPLAASVAELDGRRTTLTLTVNTK